MPRKRDSIPLKVFCAIVCVKIRHYKLGKYSMKSKVNRAWAVFVTIGKQSVWVHNWFHTMGDCKYWICNLGTRFCPVPLWHHLLFWIRFYCCVLFIKYWFPEKMSSVLVKPNQLRFSFIGVLLYYWQLTSH